MPTSFPRATGDVPPPMEEAMYSTLKARFAKAHAKGKASKSELVSRPPDPMSTTGGSTMEGWTQSFASPSQSAAPTGAKAKNTDHAGASYLFLSDDISAKDLMMLLEQHSSQMIDGEAESGKGLIRRRRRHGKEDTLRPNSWNLRVITEAFRRWKENVPCAESQGLASRALESHLSRPSPKLRKASESSSPARRRHLDGDVPVVLEDAAAVHRQIRGFRQEKYQLKAEVEEHSNAELYENRVLYTNYAFKIRNRKQSRSLGKESRAATSSLPRIGRGSAAVEVQTLKKMISQALVDELHPSINKTICKDDVGKLMRRKFRNSVFGDLLN